MSGADVVLSVRGLSKSFAGSRALDDVSLDLHRGEVHALLGENGAGKSTLIKILAGAYRADGGRILLEGEEVDPSSRGLPISFIHQDLALVESLTVAENLALVNGFVRRRGLIRWQSVETAAETALSRIGAMVDATALVGDLSQSDRSVVAIARALAADSKIVVLDEPTASLPDADVVRLFSALRALKDAGVAMLYVSHRLDEVFQIADRTTVLRDGRWVSGGLTRETTPRQLVLDIIGRAPGELFTRHAAIADAPVRLQLTDVVTDTAGPITLRACAGEVVALAGLRGAGQESIGRAIFGDGGLRDGEVAIDGAPLRPRGPGAAMRSGMSFISGKRAEESLAGELNVRENLFLNPAMNGRGPLNLRPRGEERRAAAKLIETFDVRPPHSEVLAGTLSGGNQQKVVLARWLASNPAVLILEEPTVGVDVGAKAEIYRVIAELARAGGTAVLISSDFEEVAGISNRVVVFRGGSVVAELTGPDVTRAAVTHVATGADETTSHAQEELR